MKLKKGAVRFVQIAASAVILLGALAGLSVVYSGAPPWACLLGSSIALSALGLETKISMLKNGIQQSGVDQ